MYRGAAGKSLPPHLEGLVVDLDQVGRVVGLVLAVLEEVHALEVHEVGHALVGHEVAHEVVLLGDLCVPWL